MAGKTGGNAKIVFANTDIDASTRLLSIGPYSQSGAAVDDSDLLAASAYSKFIAGDLITHEPFDVVVAWDDQDEFLSVPVYTQGNVVITFDTRPSATTLVVSGQCIATNRQVSQLANNERVIVTYTLTPKGAMTVNTIVNPSDPG